MTKKTILTLVVTFILFSCSEEDDLPSVDTTEITGNWKLIEALADPGDGSGVFKSVDNGLTIVFLKNGKFSSSASLCGMFGSDTGETGGTYDPDNMEITPSYCPQSTFAISYELKDASLIVYFPCIEACAQKYTKISDLASLE